jgi:putative membrane protein
MITFLISTVLQVIVVLVLFPLIHPEFRVSKSIGDAFFIVLSFIALNFVFRKMFLLFTLGLAGIFYYLSLGLAGLFLNALVLILIGKFFPDKIQIPGFYPALVGGFLLALANFLSS